MKTVNLSRFALSICATAAVLAGCRGSSPLPQAVNPAEWQHVTRSGSPFIVMPLAGVTRERVYAEGAAGRTIPFFSGSVKSPLDRKTYSYEIVGGNPETSGGTTYVPYVLIALVYRFPDGTVLDPTRPACGDTVSIENRVLRSPSFVPANLTSNGVSLGKTQFGDAFQRAEFWKVLKSPEYHVMLQAARAPVVVHVNAPSGSSTARGVCSGASHRVGSIAYGPFSGLVRSLSKRYTTPRQIPIFLLYNVLESLGSGGFAVGAHGAFARSAGIQPFIFAAYSDPGSVPIFPSIADVMALTHEIAEVFNDPFPVTGRANLTPPWGHIGVYRSGCSSYFEVGDPLVGVTFDVNVNGFTYHPQDLAFYSWFFRTKSIGTGGLYSFRGTFKKAQRLCKGLRG